MSEPDKQDHPPRQEPRSRVPWLAAALCLPAAAVLYMAALTCFFRWEETAATRADYFRRAEIRNTIYAPVIWLKARDPSGAIRAIVQWEYRMSHKESFDPSRLP